MHQQHTLRRWARMVLAAAGAHSYGTWPPSAAVVGQHGYTHQHMLFRSTARRNAAMLSSDVVHRREILELGVAAS
jgi:hypothetical protein